LDVQNDLGSDKESDIKHTKTNTIEILSVPAAIKKLSQKYKIQEKILASILIDKKSIERSAESE